MRKSRGTILLAEDEDITRTVVQTALASLGYKVVTTENGKDCLLHLSRPPRPDLLVLDLMMPVMTGIEVLEKMAGSGAIDSLPTVVLSGKSELQTVKRALKLGAWDYVLKPIDIPEMQRRATDLIFKTDEAGLQAMVGNLRVQDPSLWLSPALRMYKGEGFDAYPAADGGKATCVLVPTNVTASVLKTMTMTELEARIVIFRKCAYGWRKVWPRPP